MINQDAARRHGMHCTQRVITSELPAKASSGRDGPWGRGERPADKSGSRSVIQPQRRIRYYWYRLFNSFGGFSNLRFLLVQHVMCY